MNFGLWGTINAALLFLFNVTAANLLSQSDYGKLVLLQSVAVFLSPLIATNSLSLVGINRASLNREEFSSFKSAYSILSFCWLILVAAIATVSLTQIEHFISYPLISIWLLLVGAFLLSKNDFHASVLVQDKRNSTYGWANFITRGMYLACLVSLVSFSELSVIQIFCITVFVSELVGLFFRLSAYDYSKSIKTGPMGEVKKQIKAILVYGGSLIGLFLAGWTFAWLDKLVIARFLSLEDVAIYGFAHSLALAFGVINSAVLNSKISGIYDRLSLKLPIMGQLVSTIIGYLTIIFLITPVYFLIVPHVIAILVGDEFLEDGPVISTILLLGVLINGIYRVLITTSDFFKKIFDKTVLAISTSLSTVILMLILIPLFGGVGVACSILLGNILLCLGAIFLAKKHGPVYQDG